MAHRVHDLAPIRAHREGRRVADPRLDIVGRKYVIFVAVHHLGVVEEQQGEGATSRAGIDRLPKPVEDEDLFVQGRVHKTGTLAIPPATSNEIDAQDDY